MMDSEEFHEFEPVLECPECFEAHEDCDCDEEFEIQSLIERDQCQECGLTEEEHEEEEENE